MKITVTFDVTGEVNAWHFGAYLAEILELPQGDEEPFAVTGIDDVRTHTPGTPNPDPTRVELFGAAVQMYPPDRAEGDLGPMYVLDALGVSVLVRERHGDVYVHVDDDSATERPGDKPLTYEVNNSGQHTLG
jgi:hypothetical protein